LARIVNVPPLPPDAAGALDDDEELDGVLAPPPLEPHPAAASASAVSPATLHLMR
jgi:hypothetical protein